MEYLFDAVQMKAADTYTIRELGIPSLELMERAAAACVEYIQNSGWDTSHVWIVCGSGNNGGDGFAIGRMLIACGIPVTITFAGKMDRRSKECSYQMEAYEAVGGVVITKLPLQKPTIVVDAVFGVGLSREITGSYQDLLQAMNQAPGKKLAVDVPSGISASTGQILGCGFQADATVTFQEKKLGLLLYPGCTFAGDVVVAKIGIDSSHITETGEAAYTMNREEIRAMLPVRREDGHKGTFGRVLLIAGCKGMAGAAYLSGCSAYRMGAGLVQIYTVEENRAILQQLLPEAILSVYDRWDEKEILEKLAWADVVCIGPGIGTSETSGKILQTVLNHLQVPCIIDADGLNILSENPELMEKLTSGDYVLTPHKKELSRLTGYSVSELKENAGSVMKEFTDRFKATLVQKDARTMVGAYGQSTYVNQTGNVAMAKAGSGDVLAGVIAGLMAQGKCGYDAAVLGVYLHGLAGDMARKKLGSYSVLARDLMDHLPVGIRLVENGRMEEEDETIYTSLCQSGSGCHRI